MNLLRPVSALLGAGERLLDRALCVVGAVIFSQVPEFMQQYLQRLGGHLDEARRQVDQLRAAAASAGLTVDQLAARASSDPDPAIARLGGVAKEAVARVADLSTAMEAIRGASVLERPFVFLRHLDPGIARATWSIFKPAVPTTPEGFVYAAVGMVVLLGLYHGAVRAPVARAWRARRAARAALVACNRPR